MGAVAAGRAMGQDCLRWQKPEKARRHLSSCFPCDVRASERKGSTGSFVATGVDLRGLKNVYQSCLTLDVARCCLSLLGGSGRSGGCSGSVW